MQNGLNEKVLNDGFISQLCSSSICIIIWRQQTAACVKLRHAWTQPSTHQIATFPWQVNDIYGVHPPGAWRWWLSWPECLPGYINAARPQSATHMNTRLNVTYNLVYWRRLLTFKAKMHHACSLYQTHHRLARPSIYILSEMVAWL